MKTFPHFKLGLWPSLTPPPSLSIFGLQKPFGKGPHFKSGLFRGELNEPFPNMTTLHILLMVIVETVETVVMVVVVRPWAECNPSIGRVCLAASEHIF